MTIIQYDLIPIDIYQKVIPLWVKDGGYFEEYETQKLIGIANEQYLPEYVKVLTEEELIDFVLMQHEKKPYKEHNQENDMSIEEVKQMVNSWLESKREAA
jgi:phosphoribosyl 1,2-cyclic phosphodiesterase